MPEIVNWRETLDGSGGGVGTNTAEAEFGGGGMDSLSWLMECAVLQQGRCDRSRGHLQMFAGNQVFFIPYIKDGKLHYLERDDLGDFRIDPSFGRLAEHLSSCPYF